ERIREFGGEEISKEAFMSRLREKLATTDIERVKEDVIGFVDNPHELDIWSNDYFLQLADRMVFKE
ncbi:MAG: nucleotidyl transferase AbiEii/AbiGii toxin family protein, partial [Bacteroidaceae bacterium]|nr:nucleotidyl transferase AbiEii/AbiGii toxin family protein [Bacteroidaceae bacterium]